MTQVALIDYGSGNVRSVRRALESAAQLAEVSAEIVLTADADVIARAERIVLPGVGHYVDCMDGLRSRDGVIDALNEAVLDGSTPFLGVCVGMQLMADLGREDDEVAGLGWIPGVVERITPDDDALPVPHMGWNELIDTGDHPVMAGLGDAAHAYFTHTYVFNAKDDDHVAAMFNYGGAFTAAVARDNMFGTQFHPEKSQTTGLRLLGNFLKWTP